MLMQLPRVVDAGNPINLEAPLNRGLFFCARYFPNGPQNLRAFRNLVKRKEYPTINGTALTKARSGLLKSSGVRNNGSATSYLSYVATMNSFTTRLTGVAIYTPYALGGDYRIINENNGGGTYPFLLRTSTGSKAELYCSYAGAVLLGTTTLTVGRTYQIGFTIGAAGVVLFVNGTQEASTTYNGVSMSNAIPLTVGSDVSIGGANGVIEEVRLYNRELSGSEMRQLCNAARGGYQRELNWLDRPFVLSTPPLTHYTLTADAGTFTLTGQDAGLYVGRAITAEAGTFTLTGIDAELTATRTITADAGAFTLTGIDAGLSFGYVMTADAGSFVLTGIDADLLATRLITADDGAFVLTGQDATLNFGYVISADAGSFTLTGIDAGLAAARMITADAGTFTLTGIDATLTHYVPPEDNAGPGSSGIGPYGSKLRNPLTKMFKT